LNGAITLGGTLQPPPGPRDAALREKRHRSGAWTARAAADSPGTVVARCVTYNAIDEYETIFDPGCFAESLRTRLPVFAWAHSWSEPIGRATRVVRDDTTALVLEFRLDLEGAVSRAQQAYEQLRSGTLGEFSVGFRGQSSYLDDDGVKHFSKAKLDEVSVVLAGAVPGTELLSVRSSRVVERDDYRARLLAQRRSGRITRRQYDEALQLDRDAEEILDRLGLNY
jgi:HK97 family phage prohead protease